MLTSTHYRLLFSFCYDINKKLLGNPESKNCSLSNKFIFIDNDDTLKAYNFSRLSNKFIFIDNDDTVKAYSKQNCR